MSPKEGMNPSDGVARMPHHGFSGLSVSEDSKLSSVARACDALDDGAAVKVKPTKPTYLEALEGYTPRFSKGKDHLSPPTPAAPTVTEDSKLPAVASGATVKQKPIKPTELMDKNRKKSTRPEMTKEIKEFLTCPISHDIMHDPVTIVQSQQTFDRQSLCEWLSVNPTRCPISGEYNEKLQYIDSIPTRQILIMYLGDEAYQKYDDSSFRDAYNLVSVGQLVEPDASTLFNLGESCYERDSNGMPQDYERARLYYELAAGKGHAEAQFNLGLVYYIGDDIDQDYDKAKHYFELAAKQGNADALCCIGNIYQNGDGVEQDYKKAREYYERAANQGNVTAEYNLGNIYQNGDGVEQDYEKAWHYFQLAANQGDADAQHNLGSLFENGYGVEQDYKKAREYYEQAANQGNVDAQYSLGFLYHYRYGDGVDQDYGKAKHYYELAAEQGSASAQCNLGFLYFHGFGVEQDYDEAKNYFQLAADQDEANAQNNLGEMYECGHGVERDFQKAKEYYQLAAHGYVDEAQFRLGRLYRDGMGLKQDLDRARHYFELAANQGNTEAQEALSAMSSSNGTAVAEMNLTAHRVASCHHN